MDKKEIATLIDAYADAKASKNEHLLRVMVSQVEEALNSLFDEEVEPDQDEF